MASNRDILEAQRFNRKRLVTAFSSGIPGGRELEPKSRTAPLIVGIVLSVVMVIAAVVIGKFSPSLPNGWQNNTMIMVKGAGARYFTIDGTMRPVTNVTSARLLSEPGRYTLSEVSASTVSGIPRGSQVGIVGAPDDVPAAANLRSDEWTSCAVNGETRAWVGAAPEGLTSESVALVRNQDHRYVIAGGLRYEVSESSRSGVVLALGLEGVADQPVEADWLALFEEGTELAPLNVKDAGTPVSGMPHALKSAVLGSVVEVKDGSSVRRFLVVGDGALAPLTDVAWALYQISPAGTLMGEPISVSVADIADLDVNQESPAPADWPQTIGTPTPANASPCGSLVVTDAGVSVKLGSIPVEDDVADQPQPTLTVNGGSGALVRTTSGGTLGATMLITDDGLAHGLGANPTDTLARLGYQADDVQVIPAAWAALVPTGVDLTAETAWETVGVQ